MSWHLPTALTKEEHDALVAKLGRPLTQEPMHKHHEAGAPEEIASVFDAYIGKEKDT